MKLYLNNQIVGELADYGYETPWALALLAPVDVAQFRRLVAASRFLAVDVEADWGELSCEDEDREYERRLASYSITQEDVDAFQAGAWQIADEVSPQLQGPIHVVEIDERGWVTWRWI